MTPLVEATGLSLRFGGVTALSDLTFEVRHDELFAVIGPNGAGKSSLFNCLSGIYRPHCGSIRFDGHELVGRAPASIARLGVARTFQNLGLFANLDVVDNLMLGRHHLMRSGFLAGLAWRGRARREELAHRRAVERIVALLDLGSHRGRPVAELPYGVQKRIELGRALAMEPKVLLLDEPVAGMNHDETEEMAWAVLQARRETGVAVVLIEHDMHLVMDVADRVLVLDFGCPIATGVPEEIQVDPRVVRAYLGEAPRADGPPVADDGCAVRHAPEVRS